LVGTDSYASDEHHGVGVEHRPAIFHAPVRRFSYERIHISPRIYRPNQFN
jgi:hypothetical protein